MSTARAIDFREHELIKSMEAYQEIQAELSAARKVEKELKTKILGAMIDGKLKAGPFTAILKVTTARGLDTDTLKKELPELWKEYGKDTERKSLVITRA